MLKPDLPVSRVQHSTVSGGFWDAGFDSAGTVPPAGLSAPPKRPGTTRSARGSGGGATIPRPAGPPPEAAWYAALGPGLGRQRHDRASGGPGSRPPEDLGDLRRPERRGIVAEEGLEDPSFALRIGKGERLFFAGDFRAGGEERLDR